MKVRKGLIAMLLVAGLAWGQAKAPAPAGTAKPAGKPAGASAKAPQDAPMVPKGVKLPKTGAAKEPAKQKTPFTPLKTAKKTEAAPAVAKAALPAKSGRRDPFVNPIVSNPTPQCTGAGKRCLIIDQLVLRGVVKNQDGMIALVAIPSTTNAAAGAAGERAYFLRERDEVNSGYVLRITGNSIIFKERVIDKVGKVLEREVEKKINSGV